MYDRKQESESHMSRASHTLGVLLLLLRFRASLHIEILALRHQLAVYQRTCFRPRLRPQDRILWALLSRLWSGWREALFVVRPRTVIAWRRRKFREHWTRLSRAGHPVDQACQ